MTRMSKNSAEFILRITRGPSNVGIDVSESSELFRFCIGALKLELQTDRHVVIKSYAFGKSRVGNTEYMRSFN